MYIITILFFFVPLLIFLILLTLYLQSNLQNAEKYRDRFEQFKKIYIGALIILEITFLPAFLMAAQNIVNYVVPGLRIISYINFACAGALIVLEKERRLFHAFSILMVMVRIFLPFTWGPLVMVTISYSLGNNEQAIYKVLPFLCRELSIIKCAFGHPSSC